MLRYQLQEPPPQYNYPAWTPKLAFVVLRASDKDQSAKLEFEGDPMFVERVRNAVLQSYGYGGHAIEEWTTPFDLEIAMASTEMAKFSPRRV